MELTKSQKIAFRNFTGGANLFLTGKGGSGKSFLTRYIIEWCRGKGLKTIVCAPTGVAALNIGGSTIHRTFGIQPNDNGIILPSKRCYDKKKLGTLGRADVVIIDEISMCRADVFSYVANTLLHVWNLHKNDGRRHQLLVIGDFYQLPPVLSENEKKAYGEIWGNTLYAFQTRGWSEVGLQTFELKESMRQSEKNFISALDHIREGVADFGVFLDKKKTALNSSAALTICGTNKQADSINHSNMLRLIKEGADNRIYKSIDTGYPKPSDYPTAKELRLCVGAKIIMLSNDKDKRWVNGSFGTILNLSENKISVEINGNTFEIERNVWSVCEYTLEPAKKGEPVLRQTEVASISQFPVKLAWAISIHKSQGATYDNVNVDISNIFTTGQLYVALSRCKTLKGMNIVGELTADKVLVDPNVSKFMSAVTSEKSDLLPPLIPFDIEKEKEGEDRYQEGWDDGYDYRTKEVQEYYQELVDKDPGVKRLSARTAREKEKDMLPPHLRNPKGAGRKRKAESDKRPTIAIRVPVVISDDIKELAKFIKDRPELAISVKSELKKLISNLY